MADEFVYLDHLIKRESLRYKRSEEEMRYEVTPEPQILRVCDLQGDRGTSRVKLLRKPDFQRATWAWTPEDCVSLLDSVVHNQVIPSIIMWTSPESGFEYILDGGHRVSVVLAWLNDDWGDKLKPEEYGDRETEDAVKRAASRVRLLVKANIGEIRDYQAAEEALDRAIMEYKAPRDVLSPTIFSRGEFYRRFLKGSIWFHILWVNGNYERAEQSFLKINKSGRLLSGWETTLVENRNSSFARAVMSVANISSAKHYWPSQAPDGANKAALEKRILEITAGVDRVHDMLFKPPYATPIRRLAQPLLVPPDRQTRPAWLAEFLTVVEGGKGQNPETDMLMARDSGATPEELINNGWRLITDTQDVLDNLIGPSPKSLGLVPTLYFYTDAGRYVRSLLYGLIYWLFSGNNQDDILQRKRVFAAHRSAFERVLVQGKEDLASGLGRKTGSGPEVTMQTAQFYQNVLELLIKHNDAVESEGFGKEYGEVVARLASRKARSQAAGSAGKSRTFTEKQKSELVLQTLYDTAAHCGICGGMFDPTSDLQHDHIVEWHKGGATTSDNQRLVHPFCNNQANREAIERIRAGQQVTLPAFYAPGLEETTAQLTFFELDPNFGL